MPSCTSSSARAARAGRVTTLTAMLLAPALFLAGCTIGEVAPVDDSPAADDGRPNPTPPARDSRPATADDVYPGAVAPGGAAPAGDADLSALSGEIDAIIATWGGQAGVAVATPGAGAAPQVAGTLQSDVAWSTSKVPIAIASVRKNGAADANVTAAITVSDNAAAEAMWSGLGDPYTAAAAADQVLRDGGDATTHINPEKVRPEFTAFGQTQWALSDQATFGANLTCIDGAAPVVEAMGGIAADQSYGLGTIPGARFKGGWGPDVSGMYLVRQFGTITVDGGEVGVAIAARPADGTYASGQAMLSEIAAAVQRHLPAGGTC